MSWGELYALFCLETGWTWEYVDEEMTLPRAEEFVKVWNVTPPLRVVLSLIAQSLGMEPPSSDKALPRRKDLGAYLDGFAGAGLQVERVKKNG